MREATGPEPADAGGGKRKRVSGTVAVMAVLVGLLAATGAVAWWAWAQLADVQIGMHGMIALALGALGALGIATGLMWLIYYSHRHGYDERAGRE
jgi:hypothetical protein